MPESELYTVLYNIDKGTCRKCGGAGYQTISIGRPLQLYDVVWPEYAEYEDSIFVRLCLGWERFIDYPMCNVCKGSGIVTWFDNGSDRG